MQIQRRRFTRSLLLAHSTRWRCGGELAAGSGGRLHTVHAAVLAEDNPALDPTAQQSIVGSSAGEDGDLGGPPSAAPTTMVYRGVLHAIGVVCPLHVR